MSKIGTLVIEYHNGDKYLTEQYRIPYSKWNGNGVSVHQTIGELQFSKWVGGYGWLRINKPPSYTASWDGSFYGGLNILEGDIEVRNIQPYDVRPTVTRVDHSARSVTMTNHVHEMQNRMNQEMMRSLQQQFIHEENQRRAQQRELERLRQQEEANRPRRPWERFRRMFD